MKHDFEIKETLARLAAEDGFSFNGICNSSYLRHAMAKDGMKLSKSHTIVRKHVEDYCSKVQEKVKQEIKEDRRGREV